MNEPDGPASSYVLLDRVNTVDLLHCSFAFILDNWGPSQYIDPVSSVIAGKKKRKKLFQLRSPFFSAKNLPKKNAISSVSPCPSGQFMAECGLYQLLIGAAWCLTNSLLMRLW